MALLAAGSPLPSREFRSELSRAATAGDAALLRRLAREADERLARTRSRDALLDSALVEMAAGRPDRAVLLLEEVGGLEPDATVLAELGRAHLAMAERGATVARHLVAALTYGHAAAERGLGAARLVEAEARERLGLRRTARRAWQAVSISGTAEERRLAQRGVERLRGSETRWADRRAAVLAAGEAQDHASVSSLIRPFRQEARMLAEEELLPEWATYADADPARSERALTAARTIGDALLRHGGDPLLAEAAAVAQRSRGADRAALARAYVAFRDGIERSRSDDWLAAERLFIEAASRLRQAGSPQAPAVLLHQAVSVYYQSAYERALRLVEEAVSTAETASPALVARADWLRGLLHTVGRRPLEAIAAHRRALAAYRALDERGHTAFVAGLLANGLRNAGRIDEGLEWNREALQGLEAMEEPRRVFSTVWDASRALLEAGLAEGARLVLDEAAARIPGDAEPVLRATLVLRRARVAHSCGASADALADLEEARRLLDRIAPPFHQRIRADHDAIAGEVELSVRPRQAVRRLSDALLQYAQTGHHSNVARLRWQRALAHRALREPSPARADLRAVVDGYVRYGRQLPSSAERAGYLRLAEAATDALVALQLEAGEAAAALRTLDRLRAAGAESRSDAGPSVTVLAYGVVEGDLVLWTRSNGHTRALRRPGTAAAVERMVRALDDAASARDDAAIGHTLDRLSAALLEPARAALVGDSPLVVVPDKWLHRVPWPALALDRGVPLISRRTVSVAPSVAGLRVRTGGSPARGRVLAAGTGASAAAGALSLPALPLVDDELGAVAALYGEGRILNGASATPERLLALLAEADVVHLAGHGVPLEGGRAALLLAPPRHAAPLDAALLTSDAVERLRLTRRPTVVLSACRSAGHERNPTRLPLGLARAFLAAGARSVMATLWDVSDEAARALADQLHERLARGLPPAEALAAAQRRLSGTRPIQDWAGVYVLTTEAPAPLAAGAQEASRRGPSIPSGSKVTAEEGDR